ncbi:MAG: HEPN domain-containing protein [Candidatus Brennerbacteria bacterium]|nr:HEPN domain-containing protein [Candidatus Brennerbacteria bacterium]
MNNQQDKKEFVKEWILRARDDERNISALFKEHDGTPAHICFISQQIAEKYLKALLLFYGGNCPKIHAIGFLIELIQPYEKLIVEKLKEEAILLDPYYIEARYPADIPLENFTWEMAEEAYKAVIKIKEFVLDRIGTDA